MPPARARASGGGKSNAKYRTSITTDIGAPIQEISLDVAMKSPLVRIEGIVPVASYDWLHQPGKQPTIAVPGSISLSCCISPHRMSDQL